MGRHLWFEIAIEHYTGMKLYFCNWLLENYNKQDYLDDALSAYIEYLNGKELYYNTIYNIANEMFYILFLNREFLFQFNDYIAGCHEYKINRIYMPKWVKNTIYFREKARCALCNKDLSGIVDVLEDNKAQYDHMVSLESGGLNDVTNIQLLCDKCNLSKNTNGGTSNNYMFWYDI